MALGLRLPGRRAALALLAVALGAARPTAAQPADPPAPAPPAAAPPAPARLHSPSPPPPAPDAARAPPAAPLPGLEPLPSGGWRLRLAAGPAASPSPAARTGLSELGRRLAAAPEGRIRVVAQVSGPAEDASAARRLSLARGLAVKEALVAGGLAPTRIDIRPAGRTEEAVDAVDVLPPEAPAGR